MGTRSSSPDEFTILACRYADRRRGEPGAGAAVGQIFGKMRSHELDLKAAHEKPHDKQPVSAMTARLLQGATESFGIRLGEGRIARPPHGIGSGTATAASLTGAADAPGPGMPLLYDTCWNIQWELLGEFGIFEQAVGQERNRSMNADFAADPVEGRTFIVRTTLSGVLLSCRGFRFQ